MAGFFDHIQRKGSKAVKAQPAQVRKETVIMPLNPRKALKPTLSQIDSRKSTSVPNRKQDGVTVLESSKAGNVRAQNRRKRPSSAQPRLESDTDEDSSNEVLNDSRKRLKADQDVETSCKRQVRSREAFSEEDGSSFQMVHAADIASLSNTTKYRLAFPMPSAVKEILLQYPSASQKERYELVKPIQSDDFNVLDDIREVLEVITTYYLPATEAAVLKDESRGLIRRLKRASDKRVGTDYVTLIQEWNRTINEQRRNGTIAKVLDELKRLDLRLIERILTQTYSRTVSPSVGLLRQYQNGTDNVYGELLPQFISEILGKDTKLRSDQIFVDLGSGVGNVVLQAALEVGCESWGCEMMENACDLAELQEREFKARCRLWGLAVGAIHLERGDFLESATIGKVLKKADVVLVNNQAFTPELNDRLMMKFLDLKENCQIVSLKPFAPAGHKITSRNIHGAWNILRVTEKQYYSSCVSWTDAPGSYYVSTKDTSALISFAENDS